MDSNDFPDDTGQKQGSGNARGSVVTQFKPGQSGNYKASDTGNAAAVTSVYDRNEYLKQKRNALNAWADRLIEIVEQESKSETGINI